MRLILKPDFWSAPNRYIAVDDSGQLLFAIEGTFFALHFRVYDNTGWQIASVYARKYFLREYWIDIEHIAYEVKRTMGPGLSTIYWLMGTSWALERNVWGTKFRLTDSHSLQMQARREGFIGKYELEIANPQHALLCVCMMVLANAMTDTFTPGN